MARITVEFENARIMNKNFRGLERRNDGRIVNADGDRNFCVVIEDPEEAQRMADDGFNIKIRPPREEGDEPTHYLPVSVRFDNFPPKVYMVTRRGKVLMDEDMLDSESSLDYVDVTGADLIINGSTWERDGKSGVKAYLKTGYFTIVEDRFAAKYDFDEPEATEGELPF